MPSPFLLARFRPRVVDACKGYTAERFWRDAGAGATVGIIALPLAMAFAIASGLPPQAGLWTAIISGFLVSLLGGSHVQIGGPAGAFIVIVYGIVERYGVANLFICTACAGVLLFAMGLLRLGSLVRYVPVGIVIGFTNGIAVLIALSQVKDFLGLYIAHVPADFFAQILTLAQHLDSINGYAVGLGLTCVVGLFLWPHLWSPASRLRNLQRARKMQRLQQALDLPGLRRAVVVTARMPGPIIALVSLSLLAWLAGLPVETIGTRFGGIPQSLPVWALPDFSWETVKQLVAPTLTIALLGAIESLLCARVADQLSHLPRHDPNQELMAQGIANCVSPFFGGMPVTGTIARTVANIRSGGTSPVAGMVHSLVMLAVVLVAAPLAVHVPLAVLAGILMFVAWNMGEWHEFRRVRNLASHHSMLMLGTFALTVVFDLTVAVEVGLVMACALFIKRMSALFRAEQLPCGPGQIHYRLHGALFFGAVAKMDPVVQAVETGLPAPLVVLDAHQLVALDATGLDALRQLHRSVLQRGGILRIDDLCAQPAELVHRSGLAAELAAGLKTAVSTATTPAQAAESKKSRRFKRTRPLL